MLITNPHEAFPLADARGRALRAEAEGERLLRGTERDCPLVALLRWALDRHPRAPLAGTPASQL